MDNTNRHANMDREIPEEFLSTWRIIGNHGTLRVGEIVFPGKNTLVNYVMPNGQLENVYTKHITD